MQYGRKEILVDEMEITKDNICNVVLKSLKIHLANVKDIQKLRRIEKGNQDILNRIKEVRPEINNRIVENHASEVTAFKVGYVFGSPVTYVQRSNKIENGEDANLDDKKISLLNEMLFEESKDAKDQKLARDFLITGVGYRMVLSKINITGTSVFDLIDLDPETTFIVKSNDIRKTELLHCNYSVLEDGKRILGAYTDTNYYTLKVDASGGSCELIKTDINGIGVKPIVEYINDCDRMGCFERAIPLMNAINVATSDRINGLAQFVQSFIWFNNCGIDETQFNELADKGGLMTFDIDENKPAKVQYLLGELKQADTQTIIDDLYDKILQICCVPSREASTGGNTGQAILLSNGWQLAETSAKNTEMIFCESERKLLRVIIAILQKKSSIVGTNISGLKLSDIDIKFTRNRTDGLLVKTQALQGMLSSGIHPLIAIDACGLFSDPQQVWNDSKPYIESLKNDREVDETQIEVEKPIIAE
ncbi:MAG: phage portal protein [Oscillospiraceae bacterium]